MDERSLQERYSPASVCFGCGPANALGLRIRSFLEGESVVSRWRPSAHHQAFPGALNGGIVGTLLDCHSNWAATTALMRATGTATPPCTVTADFHVTLLAPTPADREVLLWAKAV